MSAKPWTFANARSSAVGRTCPLCRTIHCARDVVAVNRFDYTVPTRYMPASGGVTRATRAEAMADVCAARQESRVVTAPDIPALLALNAHIWDTAQPSHEDTTWADHWAEQAADERHTNFDPRADDRAADNYHEKRLA